MFNIQEVLIGGGGGGGGLKGDWDVTPEPAGPLAAVELQNATFVGGVMTADWTGASGPLVTAVIKTNRTLDAMSAAGAQGTSFRFGFEVTEAITHTAVAVALTVLAPSTATAAQVGQYVVDLFTSTPVPPPFVMAYAGYTGPSFGAGSTYRLNDDATVAEQNSEFGGSGGPQASGFVVGDKFISLFNRHTEAGKTTFSQGMAYIRASDSAYNLQVSDPALNNAQFPAGMTIFYVLAAQDSSGYPSMSLKPDFTSAPTSYLVAGTEFEADGGSDPLFASAFPAPLVDLVAVQQQEFPPGTAVNDMYRIQVDPLYTGSAPAPYGIAVSDENIVVIDNVTPGSQSFRTLVDSELLAASPISPLTAAAISEASRRAGEMVLYLADPAYSGSDPFTGPNVYQDFDTAYDSAAALPKTIAKIIVIDDRNGSRTINEPAGGRVYDLMANNIWLASASLWNYEDNKPGAGTINFAARCDGLALDHGAVVLAPSSYTASYIISDASGYVSGPFASTPRFLMANNSSIGVSDPAAVDFTYGINLWAADNCTVSISSVVSGSALQFSVGHRFNLYTFIEGASSGCQVIVQTPRTHGTLNVNYYGTLYAGNELVLSYVDDSGFQALAAQVQADIEELAAPDSWAALSMVNGWTNISGFQAMQYRYGGGYDLVQLRGNVDSGTSSSIAQLPVGFRPPGKLSYAVAVHDNSNQAKFGHLIIDTDGTVSLEHWSSGDKVYIPLIQFSTTP